MSVATFVEIKNGSYRNEPVNGRFALVTPWKRTKKNAFVTVNLGAEWGVSRVSCNEEDIKYVDASGNEVDLNKVWAAASSEVEIGPSKAEVEYRNEETEEEAMDRIARSFEILDEMTEGAHWGNVRALIVSGPAGIGKSYGVEETLRRLHLLKKLAGEDPDYDIVKGAARPLALYRQLYFNRKKENVLVFDDCDTILFDPESLNLLKAALDTTRRRTVSWLAESRSLAEDEIPNQFDFNGSVIFLTNLDFDHVKSKKLAPHLKALKSRCLYLDLEIATEEDMMLRIKQVMRDGLLESYGFKQETEDEIFNFLNDNLKDLQELSLRTVLKTATFRKVNPDVWEEYAVNMLMTKGARYRWLLEQKRKKEAAEAEATYA